MNFLGLWLWVVPIALWAIALWLAGGRRRDILRMIGFSAILAGLLVLVVRRIVGSIVVDELATTESIEEAVGDAWDIVTGLLRDGGLTLMGIGVLLLVAVWIAGPSRYATGTRKWLAPHIARPELAFGGAAALLALLVWWGPTAQTQRWQLILVTAVVLALGVEVLRRQTAKEFPNPDERSTTCPQSTGLTPRSAAGRDLGPERRRAARDPQRGRELLLHPVLPGLVGLIIALCVAVIWALVTYVPDQARGSASCGCRRRSARSRGAATALRVRRRRR